MKPKIIVIDDNEIIRILLKDLLSQHGYQIYTADNGTKALELIEEHKPHLVLVDLMLPDISGIEVVKAIRKLFPTTESIIITGYSSYEAALQILDSQAASGFLEKPLDINKLLVLINELLRRHGFFIKIQEDNQELKKINTQLEFFNSVYYRDFVLIEQALQKAIQLLDDLSLSNNQTNGLNILKVLTKNSTRLINCVKKIEKINVLPKEDFISVDLIKVLKKVTSSIKKTDETCTISFLSTYPNNKYFGYGTKIEYEEMFFELFHSMIMPGLIDCTIFQIGLQTSQIKENEEEKSFIEIKLIIKTQKDDELKADILSQLLSQNYGLGFYIVKNYLDFFDGKIFLEDKRESNELITTITIFLPSI